MKRQVRPGALAGRGGRGLCAAAGGARDRASRRRRAARRNRNHRGARPAARDARQPAAPARAVRRLRERGGRVRPRGLRPQAAPRRSAVPARPVVRRRPPGVRVPDRQRPLPAHRRPRRVSSRSSTPPSCRTRSTARSSPSAGRIDAEHSSVIAAMNAAGESVQLAMAIAEIFGGQIDFESDLQPGRHVRGAVREVDARGAVRGVRRDPRARGSWPTAASTRRFRWTNPASGKSAFYDENGRSLKRLFLRSPLRFEPRVTSGLLAQPAATPSTAPIARTSASTTGRRRAPRSSPSPRAPSSPRAGAAAGATWCGFATRAASRATICTSRDSAAGIRRGARVEQGQVIGRVGATGHRDRSAPGLPAQQKRRVRQSAERAPQAAARRTHRRDPPRLVPRGARRVVQQIRDDARRRRPRQKPDAVKALQ